MSTSEKCNLSSKYSIIQFHFLRELCVNQLTQFGDKLWIIDDPFLGRNLHGTSKILLSWVEETKLSSMINFMKVERSSFLSKRFSRNGYRLLWNVFIKDAIEKSSNRARIQCSLRAISEKCYILETNEDIKSYIFWWLGKYDNLTKICRGKKTFFPYPLRTQHIILFSRVVVNFSNIPSFRESDS